MAYVDLNPVRARITETPETSQFTFPPGEDNSNGFIIWGFWGSRLAFRAHIQYADQPLFSMEKFSWEDLPQ